MIMIKNIHVLPTKPSNKTSNSIWIKETSAWCNICITSDEEVKEGDFVPWKNQIFKVDSQNAYSGTNNITLKYAKKYCKKIILTTDQDLIKDGVQAITDEFLEWFVKNPNFEEVKIERVPFYIKEDYQHHVNKIIIPQEEPKQELERGITITHVDKQETLEEAAEKLVPEASCELNNSEASYWQQGWINGHTKGAKWQQERSYSEEEVYKLLEKALVWEDNEDIGNLITAQKTIRYSNFNHWFEQFKKK